MALRPHRVRQVCCHCSSGSGEGACFRLPLIHLDVCIWPVLCCGRLKGQSQGCLGLSPPHCSAVAFWLRCCSMRQQHGHAELMAPLPQSCHPHCPCQPKSFVPIAAPAGVGSVHHRGRPRHRAHGGSGHQGRGRGPAILQPVSFLCSLPGGAHPLR